VTGLNLFLETLKFYILINSEDNLCIFIPMLITLFLQRAVLHNWTYKSRFNFLLYL
jgi:hypothetical protein